MATAADKLSQEYKNWLRLTTLNDFAGRHLCHHVLFNKERLRTDEVKLFDELKPLKSKIYCYKDQQETLCPCNWITDHTKFDVTLLTRIIEVKFGTKYINLLLSFTEGTRSFLVPNLMIFGRPQQIC